MILRYSGNCYERGFKKILGTLFLRLFENGKLTHIVEYFRFSLLSLLLLLSFYLLSQNIMFCRVILQESKPLLATLEPFS